MEVALEVKGGIHLQGMEICFNPCFNGSCFGRMMEAAQRAEIDIVSILVLMEVALEVLTPIP